MLRKYFALSDAWREVDQLRLTRETFAIFSQEALLLEPFPFYICSLNSRFRKPILEVKSREGLLERYVWILIGDRHNRMAWNS